MSGKVTDIKGRVSDGSTVYSPVVEYKVDGQAYLVDGTISTSWRPKIGEERQVAYNPTAPQDARVVESGGASLLFLAFPITGILLLIIGPTLFIKSLLRSRTIKKLIQSGQKVKVVLVDIQPASQTRNSGYKIVVAATDANGNVQNYTSDTLTGIGSLAMADYRTSPIPIDVYLDPTNSNNYYVDVADIPNNITPERISQLLGSVAQQPAPATIATPLQPAAVPAVTPSQPPLSPTATPLQSTPPTNQVNPELPPTENQQ